ncbi:Pterin-4-alpha-carbinolamine dehydratase superfamily protein [Isoalcanivorax pacificus W11-5]|uniref:Putative pterin-4-alpha-carbinolamine dehydratase n=1 Tax=Isoalcanivorax pacificus W11-5 TaxID=391936 RepID=A0A0B4XI75_9GAMM|nr:4a-hydroxytetrahydrobiopterin dehydratase [Isoalcanivorax pacificus]AJD46776.1 Pterin-4-alpha-carbinolamine dehydratase superfamily protein [Isoalcanivorax pacificus W11-5]
MTLKQEHCEACRADAPAASQAEIGAWRDEIPDWKLIEEEGVQKLERQFSFPDFVAAMAFTGKVAALAEAEGHHPALLTEWGKVTVTWWSHKLRGLHRNDFICAARTDALAND